MLHSSLLLRWLAGAVLAGGPALGTVRAQLASSSPFLAPQASGPGPTQGAPLEYRGYMVTKEGTQYVIYDPARKARAFLKVNERDGNLDVLVKQFDASNDMLTIEYQGRTITLEERKSKIVSSGNAAAMPQPQMPQPPPNVMPAVTQSVVVNPTPAEEQRRLEAVAAEVSRRRALREQAQQQVNQGGSPQVNVPVPGQMPADPQRRTLPFQPQMPQQMPPPQGNPGGRPNEVRQR